MKFSTPKLTLLLLFSITCFATLKTQNACSLPGPDTAWVIETSSNSIEIAWMEVQGAASYKIVTTESYTGAFVSSVITVDNTILIQNLQPGRFYDMKIIAQCENGQDGGNYTLKAATDVIVVDIVLHLDCTPTNQNPTPSDGIHTYASGQRAEYYFTPTDVVVLQGTVSGGGGSGAFQIAFQPFYNNTSGFNGLTVGTTTAYDNEVDIIRNNGNGEGLVLYDMSNTGPANWEDLMTFKPVYGISDHVSVLWYKNVSVEVYHCNTVDFNGKGGGRVIPRDDEAGGTEFQLSPNPTSGIIAISVPESTTLQIFDEHGEEWYHTEAHMEEPITVDATAWPAGMYFVRTIEQEEVVIHQFVKVD